MKKTGSKQVRPIRRDERVTAYISILVSGETPDRRSFEEITKTLSVNAYGALITLSTTVQLKQTLQIRNLSTSAERECRVVYIGNYSANRSEVAVEFLDPVLGFWSPAGD